MKYKLVMIVALMFIGFNAKADNIIGELSFVTKPPFTGIIFVPNGLKPDNQPSLDQIDKQFSSKISIGSPEHNITFANSDRFDHNIFASDSKQNIKFDVGLMTPNQQNQLPMDWPENTLVRIGCKIHPKMRSYIASINSNIYHTFDFDRKVKKYSFILKNVATDNQELILMMPKYPTQKIALKKGQSTTIELKKKGKLKATLNLTRSE